MHHRLPAELTSADVATVLSEAGLRPTRQRVALAHLLFAAGDRHVTAEALHEEALARKVSVSRATVYNTLHQFTAVGLLREIAAEGANAYFDTNTSNHYHFFCEHSGELMDIATGSIRIEGLPEAPEASADRVARSGSGRKTDMPNQRVEPCLPLILKPLTCPRPT